MIRDRRARNSQACAVCKHQRKRCIPDCEMARYFPANRYSEFQNALKHFGMRNISKIMASVPERLRVETADSILKEGNARGNDPVRGLLGVGQELRAQIRGCEAELEVINSLCEIERRKLQNRRDNSSSSSMQPPPAFDQFQPPTPSVRSCSYEVQPTMDPNQTGVSGKQKAMEVANDNNNEKGKSYHHLIRKGRNQWANEGVISQSGETIGERNQSANEFMEVNNIGYFQ